MPQDDHDTKWVIPMYKLVDGKFDVVYSHNKKQWAEFSEKGYSDQRPPVKTEYPKTMRSFGQPSIAAKDADHEEQLRAQGYTSEVLPKGHNDPAAVIHDPKRAKFTPSRVDAIEEENRDLKKRLNDVSAIVEQLMAEREAKGKKKKKTEDEAA